MNNAASVVRRALLARLWIGQECPFLRILSCFIIALLTTPTMAQQDGAPELTAEASQAIDKGLEYLLSTSRRTGPGAAMAREATRWPALRWP